MAGISKFFSDAAKLLFMGVGISDSGTVPRKIDLWKIASGEGWRLFNCSASNIGFKGKDAVRLEASGGEGLALYDGLELSAGKIDLAVAARNQSFGLVVRAKSGSDYEVVSFAVEADGEAQRLKLSVTFAQQSAVVELPPRLIDEWIAARVVLARAFTAVFLNNSNTPSLKVAARTSHTSGGKIGLWVGGGSPALVADLKYIQSKKRDFE